MAFQTTPLFHLRKENILDSGNQPLRKVAFYRRVSDLTWEKNAKVTIAPKTAALEPIFSVEWLRLIYNNVHTADL